MSLLFRSLNRRLAGDDLFISSSSYLSRLNLVILKASVDSHQLGKMFGLQQTCSSVARGIAPIFVSSLFALSLDHQILGGHLVWLVLFLLTLLAVSLSTRVRDVPAPLYR